jgi:hypothetical protein
MVMEQFENFGGVSGYSSLGVQPTLETYAGMKTATLAAGVCLRKLIFKCLIVCRITVDVVCGSCVDISWPDVEMRCGNGELLLV